MFTVTKINIFLILIITWESQGSSTNGSDSKDLKSFLPYLHELGSIFIEAVSNADLKPESASVVNSVDNTGYTLRQNIAKARDLVKATDCVEPVTCAEIRSRCFSLYAPTRLLAADIPQSKYSSKTILSISTAAETIDNSLETAGSAFDAFHYTGKKDCDSKLQSQIKALLDEILRAYDNLVVLLTEMSRSFDDNPEAVSNTTLQYTSRVVVENSKCISSESYKVASVALSFIR